jgi:hypothetical protein
VVRVPWLRGLTTTVLPHERAQWAASSSVEDLCRLTAGWLTGRLESQPGYYGQVDVDDAEAPGLTAALVALNAAGVCTRNSQAGFVGPGYDGAAWTQHAAVTGYAGTQTWTRIRAALDGTGYRTLALPARRRWRRALRGVVVTRRETQPYTEFGSQLSAADVAFDLDGAGRRAVVAAARGLQVTIWDPAVGANTLWAHLAAIPPATAQPRRLGGGDR